MGTCESKNNRNQTNNSDDINKKEEDSSFQNEGVYQNMTDYINFKNLDIIKKQKENSICKIINNDNKKGTGFLTIIPYPDKAHPLPVLITCNHVINGDEKEVKLIFNDKLTKIIKLENKRKIYINKEKDTKMKIN